MNVKRDADHIKDLLQKFRETDDTGLIDEIEEVTDKILSEI